MANENNAVNEFIDALKSENGNDKLLENLLPQQKEEVKQEGGEGPVEDKTEKLGFHKDPKVQRYIDKMVTKKVDQMLAQMPKQTQEYIQDNPDELKEMTDAFMAVVGNDKPENAKLVEKFSKTMADFKEKVLQAQDVVKAQQQEVQQEQQAEEELNNGFDEINDEFGIDLWDESNRKLKGQFLDYVEEVAHKDEDGDIDEFPDLVGAYKSFTRLSKKENPTLMAKDLADRAGVKSNTGAGSQASSERITFDNVGDKIDRMFG